jgi:GNAT superfamily N-acetyltransferase
LVEPTKAEGPVIFSDLALARRLERAEGHACAMFAEARGANSEWMECAGAYAVFDGPESPVTQCFGLGMTEPLTPAALDAIEQFFFSRGAPSQLEVCPLAGVPALDLLCARGYRPSELSSVLFQRVNDAGEASVTGHRVRMIGPEEVEVWTRVSARGWSSDHPELEPFVREFGGAMARRAGSLCFLAEADGVPGAAASLAIHEGVALFAGAATVPELRRRGLQAALLQERLRHAAGLGCDLAMMVAEAGGGSQRNAERQGFRIAYTRAKWRRMAA